MAVVDDEEQADRDLLVIVDCYYEGRVREDLKILLCQLLRKHGIIPSKGVFRQKSDSFIGWTLYINELYKLRIEYSTPEMDMYLFRRDSHGFTMNLEVSLKDERSDAILDHQIHYFIQFATGSSTKGAKKA